MILIKKKKGPQIYINDMIFMTSTLPMGNPHTSVPCQCDLNWINRDGYLQQH